MKIRSKIKDYEIIFEQDLNFISLLIQNPIALVVVDSKVYELYQPCFQEVPEDRLILIEATEQSKVIETALSICERMTDIPAKRNAVLISFGGGIIQDITGFAANILYRGIKWVFVPTTLLAQCDSCIGGKTSLNYLTYKNLLGTFYPPDEIHICTRFVNTLTQSDFESGMGEVIKFNIMAGLEGLERISSNMRLLMKRDAATIEGFVQSSLEFKQAFIEEDEFDRGERIKLNFAHTFGHAIETVTEYQIPHGTAVAIGMIMANCISVKRGILREMIAERSEELLLQVIHVDFSVMDKPFDEFLQAMRKDKKQINSSLTAVLMTDIPKELKIVHDVSVEEVKYAFDYFKQLYQKTKRKS